jgi:hypothetical protein
VQREALDPENVDRPIDWDHVHIKINEKRELAFNWLSKAFETDFDALAKVFYTSGENGNQKVNT